jgi:phosphate transport system substrate-binding protein
MKKSIPFVLFLSASFVLFSCKEANSNIKEETIIQGETTILVDESLKPIVEDLVQVFESNYKAKIHIVAKSEAEVIQALAKDSQRIAILTRTLTKDELAFFKTKKLFPKTTPFAKDAIAFISNKYTKDTLISLKEVIDFMKGAKSTKIKGLVFDNLNSSTVRYINEMSGINEVPKENVFSFETNQEVLKYIADNNGLIGVVGINYIFEPSEKIQDYIQKINVLAVQNSSDNQYYSPTQNNLAEGVYPLARELFIVNAQGYNGLGMGFSSFIAGEIGQRIILKAGLLPYNMPSRKIRIRNTINNDKK